MGLRPDAQRSVPPSRLPNRAVDERPQDLSPDANEGGGGSDAGSLGCRPSASPGARVERRVSSLAGRCSGVRTPGRIARTFPIPTARVVPQAAGMEVLLCTGFDNRNTRFAGTSSPLTDSNRRPPPYHGGFPRGRPDAGSRSTWRLPLGFGKYKAVEATRPESPRLDPAGLQPIPKTCPHAAAVIGRKALGVGCRQRLEHFNTRWALRSTHLFERTSRTSQSTTYHSSTTIQQTTPRSSSLISGGMSSMRTGWRCKPVDEFDDASGGLI